MAKREILAGATDQTIDLFIQDSSSTTGAGLTGLVFNTSGLTCYYRKGATGTPTALTLATQTVGGAHSDGGFVAVDGTNCPGQYRLDLSDTIVATAGMVTLYLKGATNMAPCVAEIEVVSVDKFSATNMGLTQLAGVYSDTTAIHTQTTGIYSDTTHIHSDTTAIHTQTTGIYSDTTIIASDLVQVYSDTTAIHSDTTAIHSDTTAIHLQTTTIASDLVIVASDLLQVYSDTTIIYSDTTAIHAHTTGIYSDTTAIHSDTTAIHTQTTGIYSDTTIIASDVVVIDGYLGSAGEPAQGAPPATTNRGVKIDWLYKAWRNKKDQTATLFQLYADDASTVDSKATCSDDGTTTTVGEIASGP